MKVDIPATVGKVTRKLDKIERGGREAWRLTATRIYETNIDDAWDALTNPERIPRWFLPISGDFKVGGRYQFKGNAGGVIERCDPPRVVAVTWEMHGDVSWVTVQLTEQNGSTRLTLEHVAHVPEAIFDQFGPGGVGVGWDLGLMGLGVHFETGAAIDPQEGEQWATTPDGRRFVEGCSNSWAQASIAAGTEPTKATEAASRVVEFYSPQ
ncbi:MAG: SRPBCC family protein [Myxococcota bacterium]